MCCAEILRGAQKEFGEKQNARKEKIVQKVTSRCSLCCDLMMHMPRFSRFARKKINIIDQKHMEKKEAIAKDEAARYHALHVITVHTNVFFSGKHKRGKTSVPQLAYPIDLHPRSIGLALQNRVRKSKFQRENLLHERLSC